jgi:Asp-tRNA(Asn)/Glu-tRNA(Gln) amidotransferase B subunit
MASKKTTYELASLLEEVASSLRDFPDISLDRLKELYGSEAKHTEKVVVSADLNELMDGISNLSRSEAEAKLNKLTSKKLLELCKKLKIKGGSKQTKPNLVKQILWSYFDAKADLDHIASYQQEP